jgi:hypothetical protein
MIALGLLAVAGLSTVEGRVYGQRDGERAPLARAVVLVLAPGDPPLPVHRHLDLAWMSFYPKVQVVPPGSTLLFTNRDDSSHTVHAWAGGRTLFNVALVAGEERAERLAQPGVVTVTCDMHAEMRAFVIVSASPYAAVTDLDGRFRVPDVPAGQHAVRVWQRATLPGQGERPGVLAGMADVPGPPLELTVDLVEPTVPIAHPLEPPEPQRSRLFAGAIRAWPRGRWVAPCAAIALACGLLLPLALARAAGTLGVARAVSLLAGCVAAIALASLVLVGLHPLVAAALGAGALFGALAMAARELG